MSLYRQYRPQSFADVTGQDAAIQTLQNAVSHDKLAHAYLFAGSRGTGKTSTARILAKSMLTRGMEEGPIKRQIIEAVEDGSLVDLVEIDAASNRGIDDIRDLVEKIQFTPVVASAKVYIIDEVHMLTPPAFNALLKTLEEPPPYAYFILATTELQKIPATIQSRCQRFTFRQIGEDAIVARLQFIAKKENITIEDDALHTIAQHAQGGMRDAISLLDQLQSVGNVTTEDVHRRIGETGREHTDALLGALSENDAPTIVATVARLEQAGIPLDVFVRQLLTVVRNQLHENVAHGTDMTVNAALLQSLLGILRDMRIAPIPGLVLEAGLLQLCRAGMTAAAPQPVASKKSTALKEPVAAPVAVAPAPKIEKPVETPAPAPAAVATPAPQLIESEPSPLTVEALRKIWPDIVKAASPASVKMSLKNARVHAVRGSIVVLTFPSAFHRDKVVQLDAARSIEEQLEKATGHKLRLEGVLDEERRTEPVVKEDMIDLAEAAADVF